MVLSVSGLGNTGSFALIDFLREYDEIYFNEYMGECSLLYCPDGLMDLKYHIVDRPFRFQSSDAAIYRFKVLTSKLFKKHYGERHMYNDELLKEIDSFIEEITQISWNGTWGFRIQNMSFIHSLFQKVLFKLQSIIGESLYIKYTNEKMYFSYRPENFIKSAKKCIKNMILITSSNHSNKIILIDQLFSGDNPESAFCFIDNPYAIVVDRDPRDLYILSKSEIHGDSTWIPTDNLNQFIDYYRIMREKSDKIINNNRILKIQYERLIYEYDDVKKEIENFLGISNHKYKEKYFIPSISINNTQLFNKHPEYHDDILEIESRLSKWLFDYSRFEKKTVFGRTF